MALVERQSNLLRKEVELFRSAVQIGLPDYYLEEILALGVFVFERICHADELSKSAIFTGKVPYDPAQESGIARPGYRSASMREVHRHGGAPQP